MQSLDHNKQAADSHHHAGPESQPYLFQKEGGTAAAPVVHPMIAKGYCRPTMTVLSENSSPGEICQGTSAGQQPDATEEKCRRQKLVMRLIEEKHDKRNRKDVPPTIVMIACKDIYNFQHP